MKVQARISALYGQAGDSQTIKITPKDDLISERDQTNLVSLLNLSDRTVGIGISVSDTATVTLVKDEPHVDFSMTKSVDNKSSNIGSTIVFTLQIGNAGPDNAVGAIAQDIVQQGLRGYQPCRY